MDSETYEIQSTDNGFMIHNNNEDDYIHAPNGDNCFDRYSTALTVLANYLLKIAIESEVS
jgi:hypothetical protein